MTAPADQTAEPNVRVPPDASVGGSRCGFALLAWFLITTVIVIIVVVGATSGGWHHIEYRAEDRGADISKRSDGVFQLFPLGFPSSDYEESAVRCGREDRAVCDRKQGGSVNHDIVEFPP